MNFPGHGVRAEQAGIALGVLQVDLPEGGTGEAEYLAFDAGT